MQDNRLKESLMPKQTQTPFYLSVLLLVLALGSSAALMIFNIDFQNKITAKREEIGIISRDIDTISQERGVIVAKIESSNTLRPSIDLRGIVANFYDAAARANVNLKGFSIANDVISTALTAKYPDGDVHPDAATTIIKMMREYAQGPVGSFDLEPIVTISGDMDNRTTLIQLRVVANPNP